MNSMNEILKNEIYYNGNRLITALTQQLKAIDMKIMVYFVKLVYLAPVLWYKGRLS